MRTTAFSSRRFMLLTVFATLSLHGSHSEAQKPALAVQARQALTVLFDALQSGDADRVDPLLAPEFQVVRSDGRAYDKKQYLGGAFRP
jgi:hypothetical protein